MKVKAVAAVAGVISGAVLCGVTVVYAVQPLALTRERVLTAAGPASARARRLREVGPLAAGSG